VPLPPRAGDVRFCQSCEVEVDTSIKGEPVADLRDYLAEERTFLAWIRTGIALMVFGLAVARFELFADEPHMTQHVSSVQPHELSAWFGTALIAIGVTVTLFSARRYMRVVGELNRSQFVHRSLIKQGVIVALLLSLLGIAMAIYMIPVPGVAAERAASALAIKPAGFDGLPGARSRCEMRGSDYQ
jgi:putative membrane protein